jgi:23S rRNA (uracil1939-C5)-methyltransferase
MSGPGKTAELLIDALAGGGDGVGREPSGRAVMVPWTAPGDRVRVRIVEEHARWARGELVEVLGRSPARVEPSCARAGTCGGCQWLHVGLGAQRTAKEALVAGALRRLVAAGMEVRPIATPAPPLGWRRRARFHWERERGPGGDDDGGLTLGLYAARSRRIVDVPHCPQLDPRLDAAFATVRALLGKALRRAGELHLVVGESGAVHVVIDGPCDPAAASALVGTAGVAGVALRDARRRHTQIFGKARIDLDAELAAAADDFAQATADGNRMLRAEVGAALGPGPGQLLELYAGAGNFTRDAVAAGWTVTASDREAPGADDARPAARWLPGLAEQVVAALVGEGAHFDAVLLDPPRAGARDACAALATLAPRRVVYVSCDPATLGRDGDLLAAAGLAPRWALPVDLMPQTSHVEVIALFERAPEPLVAASGIPQGA